mmetsp:Transcript_19884/g.70686  ORF Transcript_19884/g.70686 Transcript_19884/m.70686 type:complete len:195 (+) Transcript_19884:278-862(+)
MPGTGVDVAFAQHLSQTGAPLELLELLAPIARSGDAGEWCSVLRPFHLVEQLLGAVQGSSLATAALRCRCERSFGAETKSCAAPRSASPFCGGADEFDSHRATRGDLGFGYGSRFVTRVLVVVSKDTRNRLRKAMCNLDTALAEDADTDAEMLAVAQASHDAAGEGSITVHVDGDVLELYAPQTSRMYPSKATT